MTSNKRKPEYWRSLAELHDAPEFREFVEREFREPLETEPPNSPARRRFMQIMGASFALAGAEACRWKEDKLLPHSRRPEGHVPGQPVYFATTAEFSGVVTGLWAKSYDGRPIKLEGNPADPTSLGATNAYHQASVLTLYDPDRSKGYVRFDGGRKEATADAFQKYLRPLGERLKQARGKGLAVLNETSSSLSLARMKRQFLEAYPEAVWVDYDPAISENEQLGTQLAYGQVQRTLLTPDRADVIVSLDSDFISGAQPFGLAYARRVASRRNPDRGRMSRIYAFESTFTELGSLADHRVALRAGLIKALAAHLDAQITPKARALPEHGSAQPEPKAAFLADPKVRAVVDAAVKDLLANVGRSLIVTGSHQPPEVHALVHRLNVVLGNVGRTLRYVSDPDAPDAPSLSKLQSLTKAMKGLDTLLVLGGNPVYTAPADLSFKEALNGVKNKIHLGFYEDETSRDCTWHVPQAHFLESWGDARAFDGGIRICQPLIAPLFGGLSSIEFLATFLGAASTEGREIVRSTLQQHAATDKAWNQAVHDGRIDGTAFERSTPELRPLPAFELSEAELGGVDKGSSLELQFEFDGKVLDGRFANNGWMQELPHAVSKLTWDNAALLAPATAQALGIEDGHLVEVALGGRSISLPALMTPGMPEGAVRVALGYGRTAAGHVGGLPEDDVPPVGADAYRLRTTEAYYFAQGASVRQIGGRQRLGITQDLHAIDQVGRGGVDKRLPQLVREGTYNRYKEHPEFVKHLVHHPPLLEMWEPPLDYEGRKWGMAIDLNKCTGCSGCVVACQAENNVPVVGKERVAMGREMHWLRIDRYYKGDPDNPEIKHQPMLCQQCEKAPCEQVCPVGATMHSSEGLNDMVYNRCIGTRYCSNNCPYKVRRFNYFNFNLDTYGTTPYTGTDDKGAKLKSMVFNPDVTVRSRGVMEKCTYCVQRIQQVKIEAKNAKRSIRDGEIQTACEQACPTQAIVFGDLNDPQSRVRALHGVPRAYEMLVELNNRTRNNYLARISNPHPELVKEDGNSERH